ncbi:MAG: hypothetical protein OXH33_02960 [bacterium]|nr:hypothetical protein [bacterium]
MEIEDLQLTEPGLVAIGLDRDEGPEGQDRLILTLKTSEGAGSLIIEEPIPDQFRATSYHGSITGKGPRAKHGYRWYWNSQGAKSREVRKSLTWLDEPLEDFRGP